MADVGLDTTTLDSALKQRYIPQRLKLMGYKDHPFLAMVPKFEGFTGKNLPIPIWYGADQGRGHTVSAAIANQSTSKFEDFTLTRAKNYAVHEIDREAMMASRGDVGAFLSGRVALMDECVYNLAQDTANDLYRSGSGARGTVGSIATTVITLANTEDIVNFEVGMPIQASNSETGALLDNGDYVTITAVDRDLGKITGDSEWTTTITGLDAADFLFVGTTGTLTDSANNGALKKLVGLDGWLPTSAPGATAFFGVNRSVDTTRLGGIRHVGTSSTVGEALVDAGTRCFREGARPNAVFMNPVHRADLAKELQSKAVYEPTSIPVGGNAVVSFQGMVVETGAGRVPVYGDPTCPVGKAYMLQMNTWKLYSLGSVPHMVTEDGVSILRKSTDDTFEVRFAQYAQLGCNAPGKNCVITLAT